MDGLDASTARWSVIPQQIMMARVDYTPGDGESWSADVWSGYEAARRRLMEFLATPPPREPRRPDRRHPQQLGDRSQGGLPRPRRPGGRNRVRRHVHQLGRRRASTPATRPPRSLRRTRPSGSSTASAGYVRCDLTRERCRADYQVVEYVTRPGSSISTRAFVRRRGRPARRAAALSGFAVLAVFAPTGERALCRSFGGFPTAASCARWPGLGGCVCSSEFDRPRPTTASPVLARGRIVETTGPRDGRHRGAAGLARRNRRDGDCPPRTSSAAASRRPGSARLRAAMASRKSTTAACSPASTRSSRTRQAATP